MKLIATTSQATVPMAVSLSGRGQVRWYLYNALFSFHNEVDKSIGHVIQHGDNTPEIPK